jgi:hypothetical protein
MENKKITIQSCLTVARCHSAKQAFGSPMSTGSTLDAVTGERMARAPTVAPVPTAHRWQKPDIS